MKLEPTVKGETVYIFTVTCLCSVLMQAVFLIIGQWDITVLLGNLVGLCAAVGNFLLLGITVQKALGQEAEEAKKCIKLSQMARTLLLFVIALVGYFVPCFDVFALVIPYLFPRLAIALLPILRKEASHES